MARLSTENRRVVGGELLIITWVCLQGCISLTHRVGGK